jgi:GR25 family glycosyltransferase involved in LPS biosynthesis
VYAGHRRIWEKFAQSGSEFAVVFEDDFHLRDKERLLATIQECMALDDRWDIVKFFDFQPRKKVAKRLNLATASLVAHKFPATGAVAYLIRREAALRLLARRRVFRAVDEDLSCPWEFGIRVWSTSENLVDEISHDLGGSLLEIERLQKKRQRSALRSLWGECLAAHKNFRARLYQRRLGA